MPVQDPLELSDPVKENLQMGAFVPSVRCGCVGYALALTMLTRREILRVEEEDNADPVAGNLQ